MFKKKKNDSEIPLLNIQNSTSINNQSNFTKVNNKNKKSVDKINLIRLFSYADKYDIILIIIGIITAIIQGFIQPWLFYLMGRLGGTFAQEIFDRCLIKTTNQCSQINIFKTINYNNLCNITSNNQNQQSDHFRNILYHLIIQTLALSFVQFIVTTINYIVFTLSSQRQTNRMRYSLFKIMLNKNISYFDKNESSEWYVKLSSNIDKISMGIGDKLSAFISSLLIPLFGIIISMCIYWPLALVLFIWMLLGVFAIKWLSKIMSRVTVEEMRAYGKAGSIAQQSLAGLRTVLSNNAIGYILKKYGNHLDSVGKYTIKKGTMFGLTQSSIKLMQYYMNLIGLGTLLLIFYDISQIHQPNNNDILTILTLAALCPPFMIQAGAHSIYVSEARGAAVDVFNMIDEDDSTNDNIKYDNELNIKNASFKRILFDHVYFSYPTRSHIYALDDISFSVEKGQTVALVGHSGSGKSSCIQLLTRLYEVNDGDILLDEIPIVHYDKQWLRQHIAIVSQETTLFSTTIYNNIKYGNMNATKEQIIESAIKANAHSFIMNLPNKYETMIGERGINLSGGERQRIALARALVRNCSILLLDEATSALDSRSEQLFQEALEKVSKDKITLIIAHRLSTIKNSSKIYVFHQGQIKEVGNHQDLIDRKGFYYNLVKIQQKENIDQIDFDQTNQFYLNQEKDNYLSSNDRNHSITINNNNNNIKKNKIVYPFIYLLKLSRPEYIYIIIGSIICFIYGGFDVIYASLNGYVAGMLQECNPQQRKHSAQLICLICSIIGLVAFFINFFVHTNFSVVAVAFVKRLRIKTLSCYFRQEIGWHDEEENNSAALCIRLSTDCDDLKRLVHMRIVFVIQTLSTLFFGSIFGFIVVWQLMIIVWIMIIIHGLTIASIIFLTEKTTKIQTQFMQKAAMLSVESISNIRTVHQLGKNEDFAEDYLKLLNQANMKNKILFCIGGLVGIRRSIARFITGILYIVAVKLVDSGQLRLDKMNEVFAYACYLGFMTTLIEMTVSEISRGGKAAKNFVELFQRESLIDSQSLNGLKPAKFNGEINCDKISFSYPTRPRIQILNQLSIKIKKGQKIALVGASGCGKSSIIQLLARFYDVDQGNLLIDDNDIRSLNVNWWRSQISLVNQDPILFDGTIKENILFGSHQKFQSLPNIDQIIQAAKQAKIHDFIMSLPQGYDTNVGVNGTQVSGGEKQRIVIARALLRKTKLLLFDEATSAMDTINEQLIQQALEEAHLNDNNTTVIVAHRLSTIRQCDLIFVLNNCGQIIESGTHDTLINIRGIYYQMIRASSI